MTYHPANDPRLDPRVIPMLQALADAPSQCDEVASREALLNEANTPESLARYEIMAAAMSSMDDEDIAPRAGLTIETHEITSAPDGNTIQLQVIRPESRESLPCVYYIHGGGMEFGSCFWGNYQTLARFIAHQGICVVLVEFRNCIRPCSIPEVAPFPAGLNDCVSGIKWVYERADELGIFADQIVLAGESGGGNLAIAAAIKLTRDETSGLIAGLYALCPYIAGDWPDPRFPSSTEEFTDLSLSISNKRAAMAYGIEAFNAKDPLAWPAFAVESDVENFPPTMVSINEVDILRDEGIAFFRLLLRAGIKAHCRQVMGLFHGTDIAIPSVFPDHMRMSARDLVSWVRECRL